MSEGRPYPGLRPFRRGETLYFFGRERPALALRERLHDQRLIIVTGPSGCGKSSLVFAHLPDAVEGGFLNFDEVRWRFVHFTPGRDPMHRMVAALKAVPRADLPDVLLGLVDDAAPREESPSTEPNSRSPPNILLLVDQFEEIFRYEALDAASVRFFVRTLIRASEDPATNIYVILTVRTEFLDRLTQFEGLFGENETALGPYRGPFFVPPMTHQEKERAIRMPALASQNTAIEDALVDQLLKDSDLLSDAQSRGRDGQSLAESADDHLPLMAHVLKRLWLGAEIANGKKVLTLDAYTKTGGLEGALNSQADAVYSALVSEHPELECLVERMFKRLTERRGEGRYYRQPASMNELAAVSANSPEAVESGQALANVTMVVKFILDRSDFLVVYPSDKADGESLVDISHESLIRQWQRLRKWADAEFEAAAAYRETRDHATRSRSGETLIAPWTDSHLNDIEQRHKDWQPGVAVGPALSQRWPELG